MPVRRPLARVLLWSGALGVGALGVLGGLSLRGPGLVAVGLAGTFVSRDSGRTWSQADTVPLNSVRFFGRTGFAVGPGGRVARTGGFWP